MENMENFKPENEAENNELSLKEQLGIANKRIEDLEKIIETKDLLIINVIHTVKNKINASLGFAGLAQSELEEGGLYNDEVKKFLKISISSTEKITELLNDFLDLERLGSNKIEMSKLELSLCVKEIIDSSMTEAENKNINLKNNIEGNILLVANEKILKSVLENLIANAIKFTNNGGNISISNEKKGDTVEIYVTDDGIGLEENTKNKLFKGIVSSSLGTNKEMGTGFGLFLCKNMLERMNGTIRVESEGEGKGTTFIISLPSGEGVKK